MTKSLGGASYLMGERRHECGQVWMKPDRQSEIDALFERLFSSYRTPILNYLYRLLGDSVRAEEVTQDTFVKAYRALGDLPQDANHRAWLYRIATNAAYDKLRRRKLIQWLPLLDDEYSPEFDGEPGAVLGDQDDVHRALSQLAPKYRAPLILYSVQGYSTREISEIMSISEGAVKTRLYRAREKFREVYEGDV